MRDGPRLSGPGGSQAGHLLPPAGAAGGLPGRRRWRPGPGVAQSGPPSPQRPLWGSWPAPHGRARPQPRPPAYTDPRSRRPRAEAHALTDLVRHPRPLVTAPRSNGISQWPSPGTTRKAAPGVPGAEGAVRSPAPRPARSCPACAQPLRTNPTRKRGPGAARPQL